MVPSLSGTKTVMVSKNAKFGSVRSEEHTSELQSQSNLVCRLLLEKKKSNSNIQVHRVTENADRRNGKVIFPLPYMLLFWMNQGPNRPSSLRHKLPPHGPLCSDSVS